MDVDPTADICDRIDSYAGVIGNVPWRGESMKRFHVFVAAIVFTVLVSSCAKTPDEQVKQAEAALEAAEEAGAQRYAPDAWRRAKESMERLNAELSVQEEKFRVFRNFKTAKTCIRPCSML